MICFYLQLTEDCLLLILQDGFWDVDLFERLTFNFLLNSKWITIPTHKCLVLYSFILLCCNYLCYDWSFRLYHYVINIFYFVASYILLLLELVFMAFFFVVLLEEIQFLSKDFPFLAMYEPSSVRFNLRVAWIVFLPSFIFLVIVVLLILVLFVLFLDNCKESFFWFCLRVGISMYWRYFESRRVLFFLYCLAHVIYVIAWV